MCKGKENKRRAKIHITASIVLALLEHFHLHQHYSILIHNHPCQKDEITRGELASLINRTFGFSETDSKGYKDVKNESLYYKDLLIAKKAGYFLSNKQNTIQPKGKVSRQELAYIVKKLMKLTSSEAASTSNSIKDVKRIATWSKKAVEAVVSKGIMKLKNGKKFDPEGFVAKGDAVEVIENCLSYVSISYDKAGSYNGGTVLGSVEITAPDVTLENTIIHGDLVINKSVGEGNVTLSNVVVKGDTIVKGGGMNSIIVKNCDLKNLKIMKVGNMIRVVAMGTTRIENTEMLSGGKLEELQLTGVGFEMVVLAEAIDNGSPISLVGNFDSVEVIGDYLKIELSGGVIGMLNVRATGANTKIEVGAGVIVKSIALNAVASVSGKGTVGALIQNVTGSTITVTIGSTPLSPASGAAVITPGVGGTISGGSGGSGGSINRISLSGISDILGVAQVGNTLSAGAINPLGATVTYQWQRADLTAGVYENIIGATAVTYRLSTPDFNKRIRVVATGTGTYVGTVNSKDTKAVIYDPDIAFVEADKNALTEATIKKGNVDLAHVTSALATLPSAGTNGSTISWTSDKPGILSNNGQTAVRPSFGTGDKTVILKATLTKGAQTATKEFTVIILAETLDPDIALITADRNAITEATIKGSNPDLAHVTSTLTTLPSAGTNGSAISWTSDKPGILSNNGQVVACPAFGTGDKTVILKATLTKGAQTATKEFTVIILAEILDPDIALVEADKNALTEALIRGGNAFLLHVTGALANLPTVGTKGSIISWTSDKPEILSNNGQIVVRPTFGTGNKTVILKATLTKGAQTTTKEFTVLVLAETLDPDIALIEADRDAITEAMIKGGNPDLLHVTNALAALPPAGINGSTISWTSDKSGILSDNGQVVACPAFGTGDKTVILKATLTKGAQTATKEFTVIVLAETLDPDIALIEADKNAITEAMIKGGNPDLLHVTNALAALPPAGINGSTISWTSDTPEILSNNGQTVKYPPFFSGGAIVTLKATLSKGAQSTVKEFTVKVLVDPEYTSMSLDFNLITADLIKGSNIDLAHVTAALSPLPSLGANGSTISWSSTEPGTLSSDGQIVNRPSVGNANKTFRFNFTVKKGTYSTSYYFETTVLAQTGITLAGNNVTGELAVGSSLTSTPSPAGANVAYQWKRADSETGPYTDISGANSNIYQLTSADFGKYVICALTGFGNATGYIESSPVQGSTSATDFTLKSDSDGFGLGNYGGGETVVVVPKKTQNISVQKIHDNCFYNSNLTSIVLPKGLEYIGDSALYGNKLTSIVIPNGVKKIDRYALKGNNLTQITIGANVNISYELLCGNDNFKNTYLTNGAGTYVGSQNGTWAKLP